MKYREFEMTSVLQVHIVIVLSLVASASVFGQNPDVRPLPVGKTIERHIKGGEAHYYNIGLKKDQVLRIEALEKGIDFSVVIRRIADRRIVLMGNSSFGFGRETMTYIVEKSGIYLVIVTVRESQQSGYYELKTISNDFATSRDEQRVKAERLLGEGWALKSKGTGAGLRNALAKWSESLLIWVNLKQIYWQAYTAMHLGLTFDALGAKNEALTAYRRALALYRQINNLSGRAQTLNNMGSTYSDLGDKQEALRDFELAYTFFGAVGDKSGQAAVLNNIGLVNSEMGNQQKALQFFELALRLTREIRGSEGEATTLNNIGLVYSDLGYKSKALQFYLQSLSLRMSQRNRPGEAATRINIGFIYDSLGDKVKALQFYAQALQVSRKTGDKRVEAVTLSNMGTIYYSLGQKREALRFYNEALRLSRIVGDKRIESKSLHNFGNLYQSVGAVRDAIRFYEMALPPTRAVQDKTQEAVTLNNLMYSWKSLGNPRIAVLIGKQSVNKFQGLRGSVKAFKTETQKSFLKRIGSAYDGLSLLMILEGRYDQALQVLNLFRDQQFYDFSRDRSVPVRQLVLTPREKEFSLRYEVAIEAAALAGSGLDDLKRKIGSGRPSVEEASKLKQLEAASQAATQAFEKVLKDAEREFSSPPDERDRVPEVRDVTDMRSALEELSVSTGSKAAALYTLIGEKKFRVLMLSPGEDVKVFESEIKSADLNKKILEFYRQLQSPAHDPRPLGKELYDIIFKPVEAELGKQKIQTLMWQLDGALRYIPISALYDGEHYLVERYRNAIFTRADKARMTRGVGKDWTVTGFGTSKAQTVSLLGDRIGFKPLPAVGRELGQIIRSKDSKRGILEGTELLDKEFTQEAMLAALKQKRPVVHIASHFKFRPGDAVRSFLLMGDGTAFTLADMKNRKGMFEGVELLTLSACETAATKPNANGREIDGFAELAQRLGANAVMATLWKVADESTSILMSEFYRLKKENPEMTKAEAIRLAQQRMLSGELKASGKWLDQRSTKREKPDKKIKAPPFILDKDRPFAHPYYWSPFILIGNWR